MNKISALKKFESKVLVLVLLGALVMFPLSQKNVSAAQFTNAYLRLDRMIASTATGGTVCAKPATTDTEVDVQVVFPAGFGVNTTASNWTVTTTNLPVGSTAWTTIGTANNVTGQTVTFPGGELTVGTLYCFNFTGTSTLTTSTANPDKTGTITTRNSGTTTIDSSTYATAVIANDQITVSATVPPTFNFVLSGTTDALGSLSTGSITSSSTPRTLTITTNASNGWYVWTKDSQQGLRSTAQSYTIPTAGTINGACSTVSAGTEGYGLDTDLTTDAAGGGTVSIDPEYDCAATTVGTYTANFNPIASSNGPANGDVITLNHRVAISGLTKAATDYSDIVTVSGAGNF